MPSTTSRGNRYKTKTKQWFEKQGYTVQLTEFLTTRFLGAGKKIYVKKDVFGADGIAMNGEDIIFWNSKHISNMETSTYSAEVSKGKKEFNLYPFPPAVKRQLIIWEVGSRKPPIVISL